MLAGALVLTTVTACAQNDKANRPSPPASAEQTTGDLNIKIDYSSPAVKEREIWGGLVPYDKVWRTGANEATTFEVNQDVTINGEALPAGKYALFTIPGEEEWAFLFNSVWDQWGAYRRDAEKDVLKVMAKPQMTEDMHERLEFKIEGEGTVTLMWEKLKVGFEVKEQ